MSDQWETFCDVGYYHMWRLRLKNERGWNDGFHINTRDEAQALCQLLNKLERDLNDYRNLAFQSESKLEEAQQQLLVKRSNNRRLDARNKRLECELAQATTNLHEVSIKLLVAEKKRDESREFATYVNEASLKQEEDLFKARAEIEKLKEELEWQAWTTSPAMAQAKIDELVEQRDRLVEALWKIQPLAEDIQNIKWGYDGDCGASKIAGWIEGAIEEAVAATKGGEA
jgi:chromosome segregation ATPase